MRTKSIRIGAPGEVWRARKTSFSRFEVWYVHQNNTTSLHVWGDKNSFGSETLKGASIRSTGNDISELDYIFYASSFAEGLKKRMIEVIKNLELHIETVKNDYTLAIKETEVWDK